MNLLLLALWLSAGLAPGCAQEMECGAVEHRLSWTEVGGANRTHHVQQLREAAARQRPGPRDRWIAPDKLQHFLLSMAVTSFGFAAADAAGASDDARMGVAVGAGAIAAVGKELADLHAGSFISVKDLAWDAFGILAAFAVLRSAR
jgi:uncharacterized protein YfiM (DUF2279 family)